MLKNVSSGGVAWALVVLAGSMSTASAQTVPVVMAQGLDNPRGLSFGPDGAIYVVEAGRGGTSALCLANPTGPGQRCYGPTGAVTRVLTGTPLQQARVLVGLPSIAIQSGAEAIGPHDIDFTTDTAFITVGSGGDPATLQPFRQASIPFGQLLGVRFTGQITPLPDVANYETLNNPAGGSLDSNLYALDIQSYRGVVTDAGANALLQILPDLPDGTRRRSADGSRRHGHPPGQLDLRDHQQLGPRHRPGRSHQPVTSRLDRSPVAG